MKSKGLLGLVIFILLSPFLGFSQPSQNSDFAAKVLPNGFSYVLVRNSRHINKAMIQLVVKAGYFYENKKQYQAAHVLEHIVLMSPRTKLNLSANEYLRSKGLVLGLDYNASTGFSETTYTFNVDPSDKELCLQIIDYCRSWMDGFSLSDTVVKSERGAVLSELRLSKSNVDSRISMNYISKMVEGSTMGNVMAEDPIPKVEKLTKSDIEKFLATWYQPNRACLIISGDIDRTWFDSNIKDRFTCLKVTSRKSKKIKYPDVPSKPKIISVTDDERLSTDVEFVFKHHRVLMNASRSIKEQLLSKIFRKMASSRGAALRMMNHSLKQVVIMPSDQFIMLDTRLSALSAKLSVSTMDSLKKSIGKIWVILEELRRYGYSQKEFDTAFDNLKQEILSEATTNKSTVSMLTQQYVNNEQYRGVDELKAQILAILSEITIGEVNKFISEWIDDQKYELVITTKKIKVDEYPVMDSIMKWISKVKRSNISKPTIPSINVKSLSDGVHLRLDGPSEVDVTEDKELGLWRADLKNGMMIILRPTRQDIYGKNKILMRGFSRRQLVKGGGNDAIIEQFAPGFIVSSGVANIDESDLAVISRVNKISVYPYINRYFAGFEGSSTLGSLEDMLRLSYLYITAPRKDAAAFETWRASLKRTIQSGLETRDSLKYYLSLTKEVTFKNEQQVIDLKLDDVFESYKSVFNTMNNLTVVFSGDFDVDSVKTVILKYAANIPLAEKTEIHAVEPATESKPNYPKNRIIRAAAIKDAAKIELRFSGLFDYNERSKIVASMAKRIIDNRLFHRLREQEGGTYFVNTGVWTRKYPQIFTFQIGFESSMQNKDKLIAATWEEIERLENTGPTDEEIVSARRDEVKEINDAKQTAAFWVSYLETQFKEHEDIHQINHYSILVNSISQYEVRDFVQKYLCRANYYQLELVQ